MTTEFTAAVDSSSPDDLEALLDLVEETLVPQGMSLDDLVRTRLVTSTRAGRDAASKVRFRRLSGPARCATSSYIEPGAFRGSDGVRLDVWAVPGAGAAKIAVEYDPPQPPCRYVAVGQQVFLSGVTSFAETFDVQIAEIAARLADNLAHAVARLGRPVTPVRLTPWVHRSLTAAQLKDLPARLGLPDLAPAIHRCDGYSAPGKLIEVEVDAAAEGGSPVG